MGRRKNRTWRSGYEEGAREEMESGCLDRYMEAGGWNSRCRTLWNMVLEDMICVGVLRTMQSCPGPG